MVPGASRDRVAGWLGDALEVSVRAPAERGRANAAVEALLPAALCLAPGDARVVAGASSPRKQLEIRWLSLAEIRARLAKLEP